MGIEGIIELERDGQKLIKENGKINEIKYIYNVVIV